VRSSATQVADADAAAENVQPCANQRFSGHQTPLLKIVVSPVRFRVSPSLQTDSRAAAESALNDACR
jgi:hypothetical protein